MTAYIIFEGQYFSDTQKENWVNNPTLTDNISEAMIFDTDKIVELMKIHRNQWIENGYNPSVHVVSYI